MRANTYREGPGSHGPGEPLTARRAHSRFLCQAMWRGLRLLLPAGMLILAGMCRNTLHAGQIQDLTPLSELNLEDEFLFPPTFFPGIETLPDHRMVLEGLAALYPGKILKNLPSESGQKVQMPKIHNIPRGITYARVYHLNGDLSVLTKHIDDPALIIDLRFVDSELDDSLAFGRMLGLRSQVRLETRGRYRNPPLLPSELVMEPPSEATHREAPILILTNRGTTGPLEAVLDAIQAQNEIITIGESTGGQTGRYHKIEVDPPYYVIAGEIRAAGGRSLVHHGFRPEIEVPVEPARDYRAYYALERGIHMQRLISFDLDESDSALNTAPAASANLDAPEDPLNGQAKSSSSTALADPILQRAVNIIVALQVLRSVPTS